MLLDIDFEKRFTDALQSVGATSLTDDEPTEEIETVDLDPEVKVSAAVKPFTPINLFQHPEAHPIALDLALLRRYGPEWLTWDPETLEHSIPNDFKTSSLASINLHKIMAVKTMHLSDWFWKKWEIFSACTQPLNNLFPDFEVMQAPTYGDIVVAADIAGHIQHDVPWSEEMIEYIKAVMQHDGVVVGVEPLHVIEPNVSEYPINISVVKAAWPAVRQTNNPLTDDTAEGEQLRRMLAVHRYVELRRQQLRDQLPLVLKI